jgi:hypothetical protein
MGHVVGGVPVTTARVLAAAALAAALSGLAGCGSSSSAGNINDAGVSSGSGGNRVDAGGGGGTTGVGGSTATGGSGGASTTGAGGGTGSGGAAGSADAGADGVPPPCLVKIEAVSSVDINRVPAGPNATLRVRGVVTGGSLPVNPVWAWTVTISPTGEAVTVSQPDAQDPSLIEFPTTKAATYTIAVTVAGGTPICRGMGTATATTSPAYWVRVLPPAGVVNPPTALANLAPYEQIVTFDGKQPSAFSFNSSLRVTIDPITSQGDGVQSYVLITSPAHSWSREGDTISAAFMTPLVDDASALYDVLVAPITSSSVPAFAPVLFRGNSAAAVNSLPLTLNPGVLVSGTLGIEGGAAVSGATVVLRAGALPSTVGQSDSGGAYSLLAREGRFSAVIVPPDAALLPEAHVDASASTGIDLPASTTAPVTVGFSWRANLGSATLSARFVAGDGGPAADIDVQLDSNPGSLADVGTLQVAGGASGSATFTATGVVRRTGTTDATGAISFAGLPRTTYQLLAIPPVSSTDGLTAAAVDMTAGAPSAPVVVNLSPKVIVRGTIASAPAGTRIIPLDDDPTLGHVFPSAPIGTGGAFAMSLDPQHPYHLLVDPPAGAMASRVPLGPVPTTTTTVNAGTWTFPTMLPFSGVVHATNGTTAVPGAQVQVFCMGPGPDCIDEYNPGSKDPLPLIESVTDSAGRFSLWVPSQAVAPQ